jgi:hypothetical protein
MHVSLSVLVSAFMKSMSCSKNTICTTAPAHDRYLITQTHLFAPNMFLLHHQDKLLHEAACCMIQNFIFIPDTASKK